MNHTLAIERDATFYWIHGASGRMGLALQEILSKSKKKALIGGSSRVFEANSPYLGEKVTTKKLQDSLQKVNVIFDFTTPEGHKILLETFLFGGISKKYLIIGTTDLDEKILLKWKNHSKQASNRVLFAPNTSLGIRLLIKSCLQIASELMSHDFDIEILEAHHRHKKDSPSGTAKLIARQLEKETNFSSNVHRRGVRNKKEIGVHSIRGGQIFGEHTVRFLGEYEEISISHRAYSRKLFAQGAMVLSGWLLKQPPGFYRIEDAIHG